MKTRATRPPTSDSTDPPPFNPPIYQLTTNHSFPARPSDIDEQGFSKSDIQAAIEFSTTSTHSPSVSDTSLPHPHPTTATMKSRSKAKKSEVAPAASCPGSDQADSLEGKAIMTPPNFDDEPTADTTANSGQRKLTHKGKANKSRASKTSPAGENPAVDAPRRSSRKSQPAKRYVEPDSDDDFEPGSAPKKQKGGKASKQTAKPKPRGKNRDNFDPEHLLQDPDSKLGNANLQAIFKDERALSSLTAEQQTQLFTMLPPQLQQTYIPPVFQAQELPSSLPQPPMSQTYVPQPYAPTLGSNAPGVPLQATQPHQGLPFPLDPQLYNPQAYDFQSYGPQINYGLQQLANNTDFQAHVAYFKEDLTQGRLEPEWQQRGLLAMEQRARGDFDEYKEDQKEKFWGEKQILPNDVRAGESAHITLPTLVQAGLFKVGDVFTYRRSFTPGYGNFTVEKEATVTQITDNHCLCFNFAPGTHKFASPAYGPGHTTHPIQTPNELGTTAIAIDGRKTANSRPVNAWKETRVSRNNQDLGTLWEIREVYWTRLQPEA